MFDKEYADDKPTDVVDDTTITKKKRGRPAGSKDKHPRMRLASAISEDALPGFPDLLDIDNSKRLSAPSESNESGGESTTASEGTGNCKSAYSDDDFDDDYEFNTVLENFKTILEQHEAMAVQVKTDPVPSKWVWDDSPPITNRKARKQRKTALRRGNAAAAEWEVAKDLAELDEEQIPIVPTMINVNEHREKISKVLWPVQACVARPVGKAEIAKSEQARAAIAKEMEETT